MSIQYHDNKTLLAAIKAAQAIDEADLPPAFSANSYPQTSESLAIYRHSNPATTAINMKVVTVGNSGRDYTSVQAALDAGAYIVIVDPGIYYEKFVIPNAYVSVVCKDGYAIFDCINETIDINNAFSLGGIKIVSGAHHCYFENLIVKNSPGAGFLDTNTVTGRGGSIFNNCHAYDNFTSGFSIYSEKNVLYRCSSHYNYNYAPIATGFNGEHADGFSISGDNSTLNELYYCLATNNSDDGFDCLKATHTTIYGCVAANNGYPVGNRNRSYTPAGTYSGDGCGFKLGGYTTVAANQYTKCLYSAAYDNRFFGISTNTAGHCEIDYCTAINNHLEQKTTEAIGTRNFLIDNNLNNKVTHSIATHGGIIVGSTLTTNTHNSWLLRLSGASVAPVLNVNDFDFDESLLKFNIKLKPYWYDLIGGNEALDSNPISLNSIIKNKVF